MKASLLEPARVVTSIRHRLPDQLFVGLLLIVLTYLTLRPAQSVVDPAVIVVLFLVALYRRPSMLRSVGRPVVIPLSALAVLLTVTTLIHRDPKGINFLLQLVVLGGIALVWGASLQAVELEAVRRWVVALALGGTVYSLFEVFLRLPPVWGPQVNMNTWGLPISMANPILAGRFDRAQFTMGHPLLFALLLLTALMLVFRSDWSRPVRIGLMLALTVGMLTCGSRSVFPVAAILLVVALVLDRNRITWKAVVAGLVALAAAMCLVVVSPLWEDFILSGSFTHRVGAIEAAQHLLTLQHPADLLFGNGVRSEPRLLEAGLLQSDKFPAVDNQFVEMLAVGGLLGLGLLLWAFVVAVWRSPRPVRLALVAAIGMFLAFDLLMWSFSAFLLGLLVGLSAGARPAATGRATRGSHRAAG